MAKDVEFTVFADGIFAKLCRTGYLLCGDWHRAEDAAQETLVRLYRGWARAIDNRDAYARRVLVRILVDESRRGWRREVVSDITSTASTPGPDDEVADRDQVLRALAQLPPRQRAAVVLRYYGDASVREAADALGCSEGNVKRLTSDALSALRGLIDHPTGVRHA